MPRGIKKQISYQEEIEKIDMQIIRWKNTIQELQQRRQELIEEQQRIEIATLYDAVKASGLSVSEVVAELAGRSDNGAA